MELITFKVQGHCTKTTHTDEFPKLTLSMVTGTDCQKPLSLGKDYFFYYYSND